MMAGPRPGMPRPQANPVMAGSGGSAEAASSQEVISSLTNLFNVYTQVEPNQKVKQETESKYIVLRDRLQEGVVSPQVVGLLKQMTIAADQNNFAAALNMHKDLI